MLFSLRFQFCICSYVSGSPLVWISMSHVESVYLRKKGLDLCSPFVPLGWKAVNHVEPLSSWTPFYPSLWKRRTLGWEDQDKRRQPHVSVLCLGSYGAAEFTANLSGNVFSRKLILFSFHCLIKWTSKMTREFCLAHFLWQQSIFPALPLLLPSTL